MNKEMIIATRIKDNGIKGLILLTVFCFLLLKSCFHNPPFDVAATGVKQHVVKIVCTNNQIQKDHRS